MLKLWLKQTNQLYDVVTVVKAVSCPGVLEYSERVISSSSSSCHAGCFTVPWRTTMTSSLSLVLRSLLRCHLQLLICRRVMTSMSVESQADSSIWPQQAQSDTSFKFSHTEICAFCETNLLVFRLGPSSLFPREHFLHAHSMSHPTLCEHLSRKCWNSFCLVHTVDCSCVRNLIAFLNFLQHLSDREQTSGAESFTVSGKLLPSYITLQTAEKILFVGESVLMFSAHDRADCSARDVG